MNCLFQTPPALAAFALFPSAGRASTLQADVLIDGGVGKISLDVTHGAIRSVNLKLPPVSLPPPWWWQFDNAMTYNGVAGHHYSQEISPKVVAASALSYTRIKPRRALEFQSEEKTYTYAGTQDVFYPDDGGASTVLSQDLTPYRSVTSGSRSASVSVLKRVQWDGSLRIVFTNSDTGALSPLSLITLRSAVVTLDPSGPGRCGSPCASSAGSSHSDYTDTRSSSGEGVLVGRAKIDSARFEK